MKIGLRTIKTAVAILICLFIYILLEAIALLPFVPDNFAITWYNPFFGGLATAYSMQASRAKSIEQAKNRCIASLIGGTVGIVLIFLYQLRGGIWPALIDVSLADWNFLLPYLLIGLCAIVVVILGNLFNQPQAIFVSLLTFLSVTVNPGTTVPNWEFQFGINRILSTIIGVLVALGVNFMHLPHFHKNKKMLFCIGMEGILKNDNDSFRGYLGYKLNSFKEQGLNYTFFTTRTPATFMNIAETYNLKWPIICMSGAALYDPLNKHYLATAPFSVLESNHIRELLKLENVSPFINVIENDVHYIYSEGINNEAEALYEREKKNASYVNYVSGSLANDREVLYFLLLEEANKVDEIIKRLASSELKDKFEVQVYEFLDTATNLDKKLKYVKIYSSKIKELKAFKAFVKENDNYVVSLATDDNAKYLALHSDYVISLPSAAPEVLKRASKIISNASYEQVFKEMASLYYKKLEKGK